MPLFLLCPDLTCTLGPLLKALRMALDESQSGFDLRQCVLQIRQRIGP